MELLSFILSHNSIVILTCGVTHSTRETRYLVCDHWFIGYAMKHNGHIEVNCLEFIGFFCFF